MKIHVSKHASKRLAKRMGLRKQAHERLAQAAFFEGKTVQPMENNKKMLISYNGNSYIFGLLPCNEPVLVTVYPEGGTA